MENVCEAKAATKSAAAVPWICCTAFVFFKEIMLNKLKTALANERIKDGVDYAIIFKKRDLILVAAVGVSNPPVSPFSKGGN